MTVLILYVTCKGLAEPVLLAHFHQTLHGLYILSLEVDPDQKLHLQLKTD